MDSGDSTGCSVRCSEKDFDLTEHTKYKAYLYRYLRYARALHDHKMLT